MINKHVPCVYEITYIIEYQHIKGLTLVNCANIRMEAHLVLLTSFMVRSFASDVCSSPVAYYDGFTINGPCPNHTLVAPVNSNVQYRCDYSINQGALTYWHIIQLSGSPFIIGEAEAPVNNIVIKEFYSNSKGYTIINIPILEEYLNKTLSVQCGLCTFATCANNPLSENISSSDVLIVAFSK